MTGRYIRKPVPLEVRGVSRSSYPPLEKAQDPTPSGFPTDTYSTHGFTISNASNSGRSSPSNVDSELSYSFVSNSWTTGNTTERSSIYSLGEDEFDRAASKKVWELFKQIDSMLFENRDGPLLLNGECQEWVSHFPHLRILGKQKIPPQDMGYQLVPNDHPLPLSGSLLTDVTEQDISGTMGQLSVMGHHLDALKPLMDGSSSHLEEEVFEQDGHLEDIIGIDYQSADDDAKTNVTRLKHSGMPPVTPQACVKDNITGAAFDFIWAEFISWLRPLLGRYARQLLTDDGEDELEEVHMPSLGMPLIDGPTFSLTRDMFPLSREASLLSTSRIPDKRTGVNRLEDLLTISTKTLLKRDKSNLHETVDLQTAATLHPRPVSSNTKFLSSSRPLSVKPMEQRHASARAKTSGRRLLAPIAGDRARTPNAEEEKNQRLQNEVIRGHRLTTMNDQITSPPPQFGRNGTLPPLDSGEMNCITGRRTLNNRVGSAAFHDKESLMHVLRERPAHPLETRPSTTHMLYRTDIQSGRRSSTPMGFNNSFKLSSVATTGNVTGQQLNVTGSSINPHGGPDIELTENFEDMVQSSTQWGTRKPVGALGQIPLMYVRQVLRKECPHSTATPATSHRRVTQHNVMKHLTGSSTLPMRKSRLHNNYNQAVR